jgi:precorrin-4/cobalt-precorrin-4 C11-methyltransferase
MTTDESIDRRHPVIFVGAGPGDPELITVKGQKALTSADVVIYAGSLVPEALLEWTRSGAERISSAGLHLEQIVSAVEASFRAGKRVVRLHTGDPSLFGAVFEQMAELQRRSIPYRVIPGVTAAFAAAAAMGIEYTLPEICQTLILTRMEGRTPVPDSEQLESLARHRASLAIYLSAGLAEPVAEILKKHYGEKADCAIAYRVSQPQEKIVFTTLDRLTATIRGEKIDRQALIIVGRVLAVQPSSLQHKSKLYDRQFSHGFRK